MYSIFARGQSRVGMAVSLALLSVGAYSAPTVAAERFAPLSANFGIGGGNDWSVPAPPSGVGYADSAPVADEATLRPFVDYAYTNQRGVACYATLDGNAGVRVVSGFLAIWQPSTLLVDAGVSATTERYVVQRLYSQKAAKAGSIESASYSNRVTAGAKVACRKPFQRPSQSRK